MASYTAIHLAERPTDDIVPGKTFAAKQHTIPDEASLKDGEVLFKTLYLSLDPAMRGWLRDRRSYMCVNPRSKDFANGSMLSTHYSGDVFGDVPLP